MIEIGENLSALLQAFVSMVGIVIIYYRYTKSENSQNER